MPRLPIGYAGGVGYDERAKQLNSILCCIGIGARGRNDCYHCGFTAVACGDHRGWGKGCYIGAT